MVAKCNIAFDGSASTKILSSSIHMAQEELPSSIFYHWITQQNERNIVGGTMCLQKNILKYLVILISVFGPAVFGDISKR